MTQLQTIPPAAMAALDELTAIERQFQELDRQRDALKEQLLDIFERHDIKKFETDDFSITYVAATESTQFDSAKFKKDHPETFELYQKPKKIKAHVRFSLK
jgi:predicted phage-related endonuclease